ncbi:MAG: hypothetical protein AAF329_21790 [Cyanobacteria bacterium P01_A01_bin.17]
MPPQTQPEDKVGGLPWGLPIERYPICRDCGKSQSLLLQLVHHPERLNLGRPGRNLFVFQCNHDAGGCASWEGSSGANACFVLEPEELANHTTPLPKDDPYLEVEARIINWIVGDDGISQEKVTPDGVFCDVSDAELDAVYEQQKGYGGTRLGGVPNWVQDHNEAPQPDWKFVGQLYGEYRLFEEPSTSAKDSPRGKTGHIYPRRDGEWGFSGPNLGDAGLGYIFIQLQTGKPEGWFFWQCS